MALRNKAFWDGVISEYIDSSYDKEMIMNKYGVSSENIQYHLRQRGIRTNKIPTRLSKDMWMNIIEECKLSKNVMEISKKYNISTASIYYQLKLNGVDIEYIPVRKHTVNEKYFSNIDTEEKAYWLGFLMADGSISKTSQYQKNSNRLQINLSSVDRVLLERFKTSIETDAEIVDYIPKGTYSTNPMNRLDINSQSICIDLEKYGMIKNKTGKKNMSPDIHQSLTRHFIRGFFDGDGSIIKRENGYSVKFTANESILVQIREDFIKNLGILSIATISPESRGKKSYNMGIHCSEDIVKIKKYFYDDATIYLERKRCIFP